MPHHRPQSQSPQLYCRSSPIPPPTPPLQAHSAIRCGSTFSYPDVSPASRPEFLPVQVAIIQPSALRRSFDPPPLKSSQLPLPRSSWPPSAEQVASHCRSSWLSLLELLPPFPEHSAAPQQSFLSCMRHNPVPPAGRSLQCSGALTPDHSSPQPPAQTIRVPAASRPNPLHSPATSPANPMQLLVTVSPAHSKPQPPAQPTPVPCRQSSPSHSSPQPPSTQPIPVPSRQPSPTHPSAVSVRSHSHRHSRSQSSPLPAAAGLVHCSPVFNYSLRTAMVPTTVLPFLLDPSDRSQVTLQNGGVRRQVWWHLTVNLSPPLQPTTTIR